MREQSEIEVFAASVRSAASEVRTIIVDGFLADANNSTRVSLDPDKFLRLLATVKPRLLYVHQDRFDCASSIEDFSEDLGLESSDEIDISPLSALKSYGKAYDDKLCLVYVGFVADTVLHLCFEEAEWYESFQSDALELMERLKIVLAENRNKADLQSALEIKRKANILASDPAFNYNRAGREKRTFLAGILFPECDNREIYQIVDEATNMDFLSKARLL